MKEIHRYYYCQIHWIELNEEKKKNLKFLVKKIKQILVFGCSHALRSKISASIKSSSVINDNDESYFCDWTSGLELIAPEIGISFD